MRRIIVACMIGATVMGTTCSLGARGTAPMSCNDTSRACTGNKGGIALPVPMLCNPSLPQAPGTSAHSIPTRFGPRSYLLHVPPSYTGVGAMPLVLAMHGGTGNAGGMEALTGFSAEADANRFLVVYPEGVITDNTPLVPYTHFNAWMLLPPEPDDVAFVSALLDSLELQLCIDSSRVFATGVSNGAMLSVRLACSLSGRIAAIAPVAGAEYPPDALNLNPAETCADTTPVPMLAIHGTDDLVVPFNGGIGTGGGINYRLPIDDDTPAEDVMSDWGAHNRCTDSRQESRLDTEVRVIEYDACTNDAIVRLYAVDGGGHTWPGGTDVPIAGYTTHQINATALIWAFFSEHPLAPPKPADQPDAKATASSADHTWVYAFGGIAVALLAVIGAGGWHVRRKREG